MDRRSFFATVTSIFGAAFVSAIPQKQGSLDGWVFVEVDMNKANPCKFFQRVVRSIQAANYEILELDGDRLFKIRDSYGNLTSRLGMYIRWKGDEDGNNRSSA